MVPPRAGDLVDERLGRVAVLKNKRDRHVAARKHQQQRGKGDHGQRALNHGDGADRAPRFDIRPQRNDHQHELERGEPGGEPQRGEAGFGYILPSLEGGAGPFVRYPPLNPHPYKEEV